MNWYNLITRKNFAKKFKNDTDNYNSEKQTLKRFSDNFLNYVKFYAKLGKYTCTIYLDDTEKLHKEKIKKLIMEQGFTIITRRVEDDFFDVEWDNPV